MGTLIFGNFIVLSGFLVGIYKGWNLALVVLACFPLVGVGLVISSELS